MDAVPVPDGVNLNGCARSVGYRCSGTFLPVPRAVILRRLSIVEQIDRERVVVSGTG